MLLWVFFLRPFVVIITSARASFQLDMFSLPFSFRTQLLVEIPYCTFVLEVFWQKLSWQPEAIIVLVNVVSKGNIVKVLFDFVIFPTFTFCYENLVQTYGGLYDRVLPVPYRVSTHTSGSSSRPRQNWTQLRATSWSPAWSGSWISAHIPQPRTLPGLWIWIRGPGSSLFNRAGPCHHILLWADNIYLHGRSS